MSPPRFLGDSCLTRCQSLKGLRLGGVLVALPRIGVEERSSSLLSSTGELLKSIFLDLVARAVVGGVIAEAANRGAFGVERCLSWPAGVSLRLKLKDFLGLREVISTNSSMSVSASSSSTACIRFSLASSCCLEGYKRRGLTDDRVTGPMCSISRSLARSAPSSLSLSSGAPASFFS